MPHPSQPAGNSRRARGSAPPWFRLASVCVVLIVVPVGLYLFLYQRSRIEAATIRNFRALDAASERVDEVLRRLSNVVGSSSFGVSPTMLDEVTKRLKGNRPACTSDAGFRHRAWSRPQYPLHLLRSRRTTAAQRRQHRYWLAARTLFESNQKDGGATEALWNQLHCLIDTHRRFSRPGDAVAVTVAPLPRAALRPSAPACDDWTATPRCIRLRELLEAEPCPESEGSPRLSVGREGIAATVADCRRLEERYDELHTALEPFRGARAVIRAIDLFGIRSAANLDELMNEATGYLSRFFDSHLIADADGRILFEAEGVSISNAEVDESQVETPGFASYVDISELLRAESHGSDGPGAAEAGDGTSRRGGASAPSFRGRSFMRIVGGEDVDLRVFVHPFILDTVAVSDLAQAGQASSNAATRPARPAFYLVGVVDDREFRSAAIRMRLGRVTNATLLLLALLTLTPLLWFWTAGDRAVVGRLALFGVCTLPLVGVVLLTVLACGMVTNRMDEHALDGAMERVSSRIVDLFDRELSDEIRRLRLAVPRLFARAASEESAPRRGPKRSLPTVARSGGRVLTGLERAFYCNDADRNLDYDPARPEASNATLLDDDGKQRVCLSEPRRGRPARTPALDLQFRDYFKRPKEGVLWRSPPLTRPRPVGCRIGAAQDEESLIPCLVDDLPEPAKRLFPVPGARGDVESPYFLERIDSVVGGRVATILAVNTGRTATPVATAGVSLNALDRAVPPRHIDFAVVDRETGRTLFHSDDDLAMTTNFVEDAGRDPALRALLRSGARDTIDLVYTGVPVRAHVRPLRPGLPWTLVVYRGHELEDRVAGLTAALSIFYTFLSLVVTALLAGLVLLVARRLKLAGVPVTLGRVMTVVTVGSRLLWPAAAVALSLLLCSPWFWGNAWTQGGGWRVLPFFAGSSIVAVAALVVWCAVGPSTTRGGGRAGTISRVAGLAALVVALAVAPPVLWFAHHRAILGVGLNHYLVDETLDAVGRAREEYRVDMLAQHGAAAAPAGDRMRRRWREEPEADPAEGWMSRTLRSLLASSELANQLMLYRVLPPASADHVTSLHGVLARTFGYDIDPPPGPLSTSDSGRLLVVATKFLLFLSLIAGHGYSVCAACTVVGSRRHGLTRLPDARRPKHAKGRPPADEPLRAIVVHRSEQCRDNFAQKLAQDLDLRRHKPRVVRPADWCPPVVRWTPTVDSAADNALYVFDDLREVLNDDAEGRALFDKLECKVKAGAHVLLGSRVVPDYRYSDRFGPSDRWFDRGRSDDSDRRDRWMNLVREFGSYSLDCSSARCVEKSFQAKAGNPPSSAPDDIWRAMRDEAVANPDMVQVTADLAARHEKRDTPESVVARFRKYAASRFHRVWAKSTHDERLQLYALALGGVVDSRRTAALSSLVNRGIVQKDRDTGVVGLRSAAFREFIEHDIDHGELDAWRKEGGGGVWRLIWPPVAIGGALGLAFLAMANPEMRTTLLAALAGLVPVVVPLLRTGGSAGTASGS